ncbi:MAG: hypothetical protein Q9210_003276 [Variospora velana]
MIKTATDSAFEVSPRPTQEMDPSQGQCPNKIEWRSRVDDRPLDLKNDFTDQFQKDQGDVYVVGARGTLGPFIVDKVLGKGQYKLRKPNGEKIKKTYEEGHLSYRPDIL